MMDRFWPRVVRLSVKIVSLCSIQQCRGFTIYVKPFMSWMYGQLTSPQLHCKKLYCKKLLKSKIIVMVIQLDRHARSQNNYSVRFWPDAETEGNENSELHNIIAQIDWVTDLTRLSNIAERCIHAQILASFYQNHNDMQGLGDIAVEYVCSSVSLLHVEDYPEYPSALSLCILEACLSNFFRCSCNGLYLAHAQA